MYAGMYIRTYVPVTWPKDLMSLLHFQSNAVDVIVKALSLPNFPVVGKCLWQLLYALCQVLHRGSLVCNTLCFRHVFVPSDISVSFAECTLVKPNAFTNVLMWF